MLYKRSKKPGSPWWVRFTIRGREIRVTSGTDRKALAEEFERRLREQIWRESELGEVQHTWEEAKERWLKEKAHKRSLKRDEQAFAACDTKLTGRTLSDIDGELLTELGQSLGEGRRPATVNRILRAVLGTLSAAVRWGWLNAVPKIEAQYVETKDPTYISSAQFELLAWHLPPHLARMARFAVATGLRWSNVSGLRWELVDMERRFAYVPRDETKAGKPIPVPLSDTALEVLKGVCLLGHSPSGYVFTDHLGRAPIGSPKTAWAKACKRAGLQGFRFHDLRHTWAAWHTMNGTPPIVLKELGGWSSLSMVERYSALNPGHLSEWANNTSRTKNGTEEKSK